MLRKLRSRLSYANVMSTIAVFLALGGVGAYAADEWNGSNIQDETLTGADVKGKPGSFSAAAVDGSLTGLDISGQAANAGNHTPFVQGSLTGADIKDKSLKDEDVGKATFVNFAASLRTVGAHQCFSAPITGTNAAQGDHLLLTASNFDSPALADSNLVYSVRYDTQDPRLWFCNPTDGSVPAGTTHFSLLVIDGN